MSLAPVNSAGRLSLARIAGFMGVLGITLILGVSAFLGWNEYQRRSDGARQEMRSTAFFLADHASRLMEVADIALRGASARVSGLDWDAIEHAQDLQAQLGALSSSLPYVDDIWLNDETGRLRLTTFAFPAPVANARERDVFKQLQVPGDLLAIGQRIIGAVTKEPTFLIARRLSNPDGSFRGMVSVTAELKYFNDYWSKLQLPLDARVRLVRAETLDILAQHPALTAGTAATMPLNAGLFRRAMAADPVSGLVDTPSAGEEGERLVAYRRVGDLPLYLLIGASKGAIMAEWRAWVLLYLPFSVAALAGLALLSVLAFRQARRESEDLAEIRRGRGALAEANTRLEARVAERTAELQEANEETQRFAYIVSHDLRAPLVNIMGFTSELEGLKADLVATERTPEQGAALVQDFEEALGFIKAAIAKMDRLIGAILKISREGRRLFRPEPLDMTALVTGLADAQRHQADTADVTITVGDLPPLTADRLAVEQVFGNLVDNAIKYMQPGRPGTIEITGRLHGGYAIFEVADNGRGIAPEDRTRVFELFRRAGVQDKPGEGIGLAHVRTLVRSLGGQITLKSQPGEGTTFIVTVPRNT